MSNFPEMEGNAIVTNEEHDSIAVSPIVMPEHNEFDERICQNEVENDICIPSVTGLSEKEPFVNNDRTKFPVEMLPSNHETATAASPVCDEYSKELKLDPVVDRLTSGLLTAILPAEEQLKKKLNDVIQSQNVLVETIEHENSKFREIQLIKEVSDIMDRARSYQVKLTNIQKEMMSLHDKTSQLKRRALKLQQQKQKEALQKEQQRDEELEKEKKLMAKVILRKV